MMGLEKNTKWKTAALMLPIFMLAWPAGISLSQGIAAAGKTAVTQSPAPKVRPQQETYYYNPEGRIDPFKPFIDLEAAARKKAEQTKVLPINPLQRLGIDQFRLVGIIESEQGRRAMVQDMAGKFYTLVRGTYIGLNNGLVVNILKDSVIVNERVTTDEGKIQSRSHIMKLRPDEVKP